MHSQEKAEACWQLLWQLSEDEPTMQKQSFLLHPQHLFQRSAAVLGETWEGQYAVSAQHTYDTPPAERKQSVELSKMLRTAPKIAHGTMQAGQTVI